MKKLNFYKKNNLNSSIEVFDYFLKTMIPNNRTWDYFLNWNKIVSNTEKYSSELGFLNTLCGSNSFDEELRFIVKKNPRIIKLFPVLLAIRDQKISVLDSFSLPEFHFKDFSFNKSIDEKEIDLFVEFFKKSGLKDLISKGKITNIHDYVLGVEAGLDTNARKNRGGTIMEGIVKNLLKNVYSLNSSNLIEQATNKKVQELWDISLPTYKTNWTPDFIVKSNDKLFCIETNFYSSGGSKLKSTCGEYKEVYKFCKSHRIEFIWITDGGGWKTAKKPIEETFLDTDYIFNLTMIKDGILDELFV